MTYDYILALDPSGSFNEGKGTTGWCVLEEASQVITMSGELNAKSYKCIETYWQAHLQLIADLKKRYGKRLVVVIEDFILYAQKAQAQINSRLETPKLIGILQYYCYTQQIPYHMQLASQVKKRWNDQILHYKGYVATQKRQLVIPRTNVRLSRHCKDAIRHAVHYSTFKNKGA
jgi:hypothetical protein